MLIEQFPSVSAAAILAEMGLILDMLGARGLAPAFHRERQNASSVPQSAAQPIQARLLPSR